VVSFAPNAKGSMAAMLTISSNDADESAFTISLLATSQVTGPCCGSKRSAWARCDL
jgi:hypothetical protein